MSTEQKETTPPVEAPPIAQTNMSDIEDGEISQPASPHSPKLDKDSKDASTNKSKKHKKKRAKKVYSSSSDSSFSSGDDLEEEYWNKKKHHSEGYNQVNYLENSEEDYDEEFIEEPYGYSWNFGPNANENMYLHSKSQKKKKSKKNKKKLYPCKSYIAYGKCDDPNCRCVHAPLTNDEELHRFIEENEDFFLQVFKKIPEVPLPLQLFRVLNEKFRHLHPHPHSQPDPFPFQNSLPRPMPPPKFLPMLGHYPLPPSAHPSPNDYNFASPPLNARSPPFFSLPPPMHPSFNPGLLPPPLYPGHMFPQNTSLSNHPQGILQISPPKKQENMSEHFVYSSSIIQRNHGQQIQNREHDNFEKNMNNEYMHGPQKKEEKVHRKSSKDSGKKKKKGSHSSHDKRGVGIEIDRITGRYKEGKAKRSEKGFSPDTQSQETSSETPENKASREEEAKKASTTEKITRLVELFKAKQMKKTPDKENTSQNIPNVSINSEPEKPLQGLKEAILETNHSVHEEEMRVVPNNSEVLARVEVNKVEEPIKMVEISMILNGQERKDENLNKEISLKNESSAGLVEKAKTGGETIKSKFENSSINEALLKQLKSALPQTGSNSPDKIKNLVNMYLKISKNPGLQNSI